MIVVKSYKLIKINNKKNMLNASVIILIIMLLSLRPLDKSIFSLWGNIKTKMVEAGVIDEDKFENLIAQEAG